MAKNPKNAQPKNAALAFGLSAAGIALAQSALEDVRAGKETGSAILRKARTSLSHAIIAAEGYDPDAE